MGDQGGFDPCECFNFHEIAMRRLLNMLRQSQSYCTDSECIDDISGTALRDRNEENIFMMSVICIVAFLIYYLRPQILRNRVAPAEKPWINRRNDSNGTPPTPPPGSS